MTETNKGNRHHAQEQARIARFNRLPRFARWLVADREAASWYLEVAPFTRTLFAAGFSPTPGMGLAEFDACIAIVKDALGIARLSDAEFEYALRLSIPPECRETAQ